MEERDFDVAGIREGGVVVGYVRHEDLKDGTVRDHQVGFGSNEVSTDSEGLISAFESLRQRTAVFVTILGQTGGVVTRSDLQKAPVRMWVFGLVSLIEMQMERLIREKHTEDSLPLKLSDERLTAAKKIFDQRKKHNEEIDLTACLQIGDKGTIFSKDEHLFRITEFSSKKKFQEFLAQMEKIRNRLAHAQDIIGGAWPQLVDLLIEAERVLEHLEKATFQR
jgi:hypothetical protein